MASFDTYFSVLALFILFRETIEASIICSVLLQFLNRAKPVLKRTVWYAVAAGVGVSIIFGIIFIVIFYTARDNLFKGKNRDWFKGIISWIAALLITILAFAMLRFLGWEAKWKRKLTAALAAKVAAPALAEDGSPAAITADGDAVGPSVSAAVGKDARDVGSDSDAATRTSCDLTSPRPDSTGRPDRLPSQHHQPSSAFTSPTLVTTSSGSASASAAAMKKADDGAIVLASEDVEANAVAATEEPVDGRDMTPATRKEKTEIFLLVFTTVVREGIESVVFLGGLGNVKLTAIPLPAFVGILSGCLVGIFLYYSGKQVKHIKWLVIIMAIIIFFIAAGQVNIGTDALMRAGAFGECSPWYDERPWFMVPVYDWSACCNDIDPVGTEPIDEQNRRRFFALARAIFGYQDKGTPLELIIYCSYWALVFLIMLFKAWRGTLFDADYKYTREQKRLAKAAAAQAAADAEAAAEQAKAAVALEAGEDAMGEADGAMVQCALDDAKSSVTAATSVKGEAAAAEPATAAVKGGESVS